MRVLVSGSRVCIDYSRVLDRLRSLPSESIIVQGGARGTDALAKRAAAELNLGCETWEADWERFGRSAGPIRNNAMLDSKPDLVLAFWDGRSPGTRHTITQAHRRGIPVEIIKDNVIFL